VGKKDKQKQKQTEPKTKLLVVEDDLILLGTLEYNLAAEGYRVLTATDGLAALEVARKEQPDLVVLDVMLPGLDGFEVCRILRRETHVPILMLTARVSETDRVVGLEVGADDYLTKPFSMRELLARVKALLRRVGTEGHPSPHCAGHAGGRAGSGQPKLQGRHRIPGQGALWIRGDRLLERRGTVSDCLSWRQPALALAHRGSSHIRGD
jgi:DNA-binding response OmpR family regulator